MPTRVVISPLWLVAWLSVRTPVFDRRTFPVPRSTSSWWVSTYVGKLSAIRSANQADSAFHPFGIDGWVLSSKLIQMCATLLGDTILWMLTKCMQDGLFHSWINVWVAGKTVWTPCHSATCRAAGIVKSSLSVGRCAFAFAFAFTTPFHIFGRLSVTFKAIHLLQAFPNVIFCTAVPQDNISTA